MMSAFGGDVNRITLFGSSAGGCNINAILLSPLVEGLDLFNRGILQSCTYYGYPLDSLAERGQKTRRLAASQGCNTDSIRAIVDCLQEIDAWDLVSEGWSYFGPADPLSYGNRFLPEHPTYYMDRLGNGNRNIELMLGMTSEEGSIFWGGDDEEDYYMMYGVLPNDTMYTQLARYALDVIDFSAEPIPTDPLWRVLRNHHLQNESDPIANMRGFLDMIGQAMFSGIIMRAAQRFSEAGFSTYVYYFDQVMTSDEDWIPWFPTRNPELPLGVAHGEEEQFVFGAVSEDMNPDWTVKRYVTPQDHAVGRAVVHAWTTFAKTGNPAYVDEVGQEYIWPEYDFLGETYLDLKYPMDANSTRTRLLPTMTNFYATFLPMYRGPGSKDN